MMWLDSYLFSCRTHSSASVLRQKVWSKLSRTSNPPGFWVCAGLNRSQRSSRVRVQSPEVFVRVSHWLVSPWYVDTVKNPRTKTVELFLYGRRSAEAERGLRFLPISPLWFLWREEASNLMGSNKSLKKTPAESSRDVCTVSLSMRQKIFNSSNLNSKILLINTLIINLSPFKSLNFP